MLYRHARTALKSGPDTAGGPPFTIFVIVLRHKLLYRLIFYHRRLEMAIAVSLRKSGENTRKNIPEKVRTLSVLYLSQNIFIIKSFRYLFHQFLPHLLSLIRAASPEIVEINRFIANFIDFEEIQLYTLTTLNGAAALL